MNIVHTKITGSFVNSSQIVDHPPFWETTGIRDYYNLLYPNMATFLKELLYVRNSDSECKLAESIPDSLINIAIYR